MNKSSFSCKSFICLILSVLMALTCMSTAFAKEPETTDIILEELGGEVVLHTDLQCNYLFGKYYNISRYADGTEELSRPRPVSLTWTANETVENGNPTYYVEIAESEDFSDGKTYVTTETEYDVYNLKIGTEYYWHVSAETESGEYFSNTSSFRTETVGPRNMYVDGLTNVRDIGGYPTVSGGRVKQGNIIRCARLNNTDGSKTITAAGIDEMVNNLGIKSEIELRMNADNDNGGFTESVLGKSVNYYVCPMDWHGTMLEEGLKEDNFDSIRKLFAVLSDEKNYPVIFHCSIGTDRTGLVAFMLEGLLGVSETDLYRDYLFSNFGNIGGSRDVAGIRKKYPAIFRNNQGNTLSERIYNYLKDDLHVPAEQLDEFIRINTEPYDCRCGLCYKGATVFKGDINGATITAPKSHILKGTPVATEKDFLNMDRYGSYFLADDLTLNASYPGEFCGKLDGNGHKLTVSKPVFEKLGGSVIDLEIDGNIETDLNSCGALASEGREVYVRNVISNADITSGTGTDAAGIVGKVTGRGRFICCTNNGKITSKGNIGGIVAMNCLEFTAERCINNGAITCTAPFGPNNAVGGILGYSEGSAFIQNCENNAQIQGKGKNIKKIAGELYLDGCVNTAIGNMNDGKPVNVETCKHICHKDGLPGMLWKIAVFFVKLFNGYPYCECGDLHYTK